MVSVTHKTLPVVVARATALAAGTLRLSVAGGMLTRPPSRDIWRFAADGLYRRLVGKAGCDGRRLSTSGTNDGLASAVAERLQTVVTPEIGQLMSRQGFAVVDGVFGDELSKSLRREILALRSTPLFHANATHLVKDGETHLLQKKNVWEAEAMAPDVQEASSLFRTVQNDTTLMTMLNVVLPSLALESQAVKLHFNEGGCFPIHNDSDEMVDGRRVTAIFYLNPDWEPSHGGELRLYPFPLAPPVDVPPVNDRVVMFASTRMPHRVLPSSPSAKRCCFTCWLSTSPHRSLIEGVQRQSAPSVDCMSPAEAARYLVRPRIRKHFIKLVYNDEWLRSLKESHPEGSALDNCLSTHEQEVRLVTERLAPYIQAILPGAIDEMKGGLMSSVSPEDVISALQQHGSEQLDWL